MIDLLRISGAASSRTLNTINQWATGVQNSEDLHMEQYWNYLTENLERPDNLHDMKQILHTTTWETIRSVYSNIADGHTLT